MNDRHKMMYKEQMQMTPGYKAYNAQGKTMMASYQPVQQPAQPHMMSPGMMTSTSVQRHAMTSHAMATHGLPGQHGASMPTQDVPYVLPGYKTIPASPSAQSHSQVPPVQAMYCVEQTGSIQSGKPPQRAPSYPQESVPSHSARPGPQGYGSTMLPPSSSIRTGGAAPSGSIRTGTVGQNSIGAYVRTGIPENTVNSGLKVRPTYYMPPGSHVSHPVVVPHSPSSHPPAAPQPPKAAPVPSPGGGSMPPQQQRRYPPQPAPQPQAQPPLQPHQQQPPSPRVMSAGSAPLPPQEGFGSAPRSKPTAPPAGVVNGALDLTCMTETPGPLPAKSGDAPLDLSVKVKKRPAEPGEIERLSPPSKKPRSQFTPSQFAPPSSPVLDLRSPEPPLVPRGQVGLHAASPQAAGGLHRARNAYDTSPHPGDMGRRGSVGSVGSAGSSPSPTVKMTPPEMKHGVPPSLTPQQPPQQPPQLIKASPGMYLGYPGTAPVDRKPAANPQQPQQQSPQSLYPPHSPRHSSYSPLASPGAQSTHAQFKAGMQLPGARGGTSPRSTSGGVVRSGEREVVVQRNGYPGFMEPQTATSGVIRSGQDVMGPPSSPQVSAMKSESAQMRMVQQQQQHPQHQQRLPHQQDPIHHHHQQQQHPQQAQQHHHHAQQQQQQQLPHHQQQYSHDVHYQRQMQQHHQQQQQQQQHQHQQQHHQQHHQQAQHQQQEEMQKAKTYGAAAAEAAHSRGYPGHPHAYPHPSPTTPSVAGYPGKGVPSGTMGHPHVPVSSPHHLSNVSPHHLSPSMRDPSHGLAPSSQQRQTTSAQGMSRPHAMPTSQSVPAPQQRAAGGAPVSMQGQPVPRSTPGQGQPHPSYSNSSRVPQHAGSGPMYREEPGMARVGSSVSGHHPRSAEQSPSAQMYPGMYPPRTHLSPGTNSAGVSPQLSPQQPMVHGASPSQPHPKSSPAGQGLSAGSGHLPISQHPSPAVGRSSSAERGAVPVSVNGPASGGMSSHPPSSGSVAAYHVPPGGTPSLHPSASGIGAFQSPANGLPSQMYQTGLAAPMGQPHVPATAQTLPPRQASYDRQASGYDRQQAMRSPSTTRAPSSAAGGFRPAASYSHPASSHASAPSSMVSQERSLGQVAEMHSNMAAASGARMRADMLEQSVHAQRPKPLADPCVTALTSTNVISVTSVTVTSSQALSTLSAPRTTVTQALTSSVMSSTTSPSSVVSSGSLTSVSPALKAEEVGVAGPRPKVDPAKLSQLSQPLEIAIPGASGTSGSSSTSSRPATDLPPPTGTAPKCAAKQPQPAAGPSSSSSTSSSPKLVSRKHRLMTAFNKDEDLRRMQPPANPPDPSKASTSSSGDFKAPTVSPSSPPSPKMPILSPQQAPAPQTSPMHNEPPTLDPPATSEKRALMPVVKDRHGMFPHASGMDKARGTLQPKPTNSAAFRGMAKPAIPSSVLTAGPSPKSQVRTSVVMSVSSTLEGGLTSSTILVDSAGVASVSESTPGNVPSAPVGPAPQPSEGQCADKGRSSTDAPSSTSTSSSSGGAPVGPVDMPVSKDDMSCNAGDGSSSGGGSVFPNRRNSLPDRHWYYSKNIPVANVAPFQHAKASKDGREMVVGPDEDCSTGQTQDPNSGTQDGSPADVKMELEEEEKNEDEKDVPSPTGNQSRRQSPRKVPYMRKLMRLSNKAPKKKDLRFLATPLKLRLLRASQEFPDMDDSIAVDKANAASSAGRRKKQQQQQRRKQQQERQQRRRRRQQQQQQQQRQQEKNDGAKGKRSLLDDLSWPASKKSRDPGDLLADDPALLGREERALRRAIIEIDKMESKGDPRDSRVATRRTAGQVSNANRKAQELKKRALGDRRRARDLSRRPLRSCTLRQRRFSDFEPTPLQRRPRRRRCQTRYNRNAAYEKELKREESRKALKRRQRERMRAGQTAHSDSDDTTDGEREEEGEEDEDEDLERVSGSGSAEDEGSKQGESEDGSGGPGGRWEIKVAGTAGAKRALRSGRQSRGGLMMKLQWRRGAERKTNFGRPIRRRLELSPDSSDTGNAHHQQRYPATGSRRRQGKQSRSRPESDHELLFTEESSDSDQSQVSGRLPFQDVAEDSNSVPAPPELRKLAVNKNSGETILHKATKPGYEEVALYCLRTRSVEVNARDNAGYTPLHECCVRGNLTVAWYLILHGADVNCCSQDGIRPVHDAVENEHVEIVRLLLSCGADPSIATYAGKTPLKIARSQVMRDLIRGYLADLNGWECEGEEEQEEEEEEEVPWLFQGSSDFMDPAECSGFDVYADIPSDPEDEPEEMFDDDLTAAVPTYDLQVAGSSESDRFVLVEEAARELGVREEEVMRLCGRDGPCLRREEFLQLTSHCVIRPRQPKTERVRLLRLSTLKQHAEALSALAGKQGATASSGAAPASGKHSPARQGYSATKAGSVGTPGANKTLPNTRQTPNLRQAGDEQGSALGLTSSASFPPGPGHRAAYGKTRVVSGPSGQGPLQCGSAPVGKTSPGGSGPHSQMFKPIKESPRKQASPMGPYPQGARRNFRDDLSVSLQKLNTTKVPQPRRPQVSAPSGRPTWTTTSPSASTLPMSSTSLTSNSSSSFTKSSPGPLSSSRSASLPLSAAAAMQSVFSTSSSTTTSSRMAMSLGGKQPGGAHLGPALTPGMKSHSYPLQGRSATAGSGAKGPLTLLSGKATISTSRTAMTTFGQPSVVLSNSRISGEGRSAFVSKQGAGAGRPLTLGPGSSRQEVGQDLRGVRERGAAGEGQAKEDVYKFKVGTVPEDCFELASMKVLNGGSHSLKAPGNQP